MTVLRLRQRIVFTARVMTRATRALSTVVFRVQQVTWHHQEVKNIIYHLLSVRLLSVHLLTLQLLTLRLLTLQLLTLRLLTLHLLTLQLLTYHLLTLRLLTLRLKMRSVHQQVYEVEAYHLWMTQVQKLN